MKEKYSSEEILQQFDAIYEVLDCGDNSCLFKKKNKLGTYGMRTNGGCRCLKNLPPKQWQRIKKLLQMLKYNKEIEERE